MRALFQGFVAVVVLAASSSAFAGAPDSEKGERSLAKMLEGRTAGQPVKCINPANALSSEILDGTAIVYRMPGGKLYVNRPSLGAAHLDHDNLLRSQTFGTQLCNNDMVTLIERGGMISSLPAAFIAMGPFVPYSKVDR